MGCPPEAEWDGRDGAVVQLRNRLGLADNQTESRFIRHTMERIVAGDANFDAAVDTPTAQRALKMGLGEAKIAADCLVSGFGQWQAMHNVNARRAKKGLSLVSRSCIRLAAFRVGVHKLRRRKQKSGNTDPESKWAKARLAQALQVKGQLATGSRTGAVRQRGRQHHLPAGFKLEQIAWWDEKHSKCVLGCASKYEYQQPEDEGGEFLSFEEGGEYPERKPVTSVKFPQEARMCFGVMMKPVRGRMTGFKFAPFEYTGKKMLGVAAYKKEEQKELDRVLKLKREWAKFPEHTAKKLPGGRYQLRWPRTWQAELRTALGKARDGLPAVVCVTELMDHVIAEGNCLFAGTPFAKTWIVFHDALSQWWEAGAQEYMLSRGFPLSRQVACQGDTNEGTRYEGKLVGDSPEVDPLDSNLFSDVEHGMKLHVAITAELPVGDPNKFGLGTPNEVASTMRRTWEVAPTPERVVQDISRFPAAVDAIIAARGAKVPELDNRRGRRATKRVFEAHPCCREAQRLREAKWARLDS